ncbi:MAG: glycosyltransferase family 4 protein, partial [Acidimicrobiales bacterium]
MKIERIKAPVMLPTFRLADRINRMANDMGAGLVVLDPALPLGLIAPLLKPAYAVVVHGAEVTVPNRLPGLNRAL